jgi:hypothetical protein
MGSNSEKNVFVVCCNYFDYFIKDAIIILFLVFFSKANSSFCALIYVLMINN